MSETNLINEQQGAVSISCFITNILKIAAYNCKWLYIWMMGWFLWWQVYCLIVRATSPPTALCGSTHNHVLLYLALPRLYLGHGINEQCLFSIVHVCNHRHYRFVTHTWMLPQENTGAVEINFHLSNEIPCVKSLCDPSFINIRMDFTMLFTAQQHSQYMNV